MLSRDATAKMCMLRKITLVSLCVSSFATPAYCQESVCDGLDAESVRELLTESAKWSEDIFSSIHLEYTVTIERFVDIETGNLSNEPLEITQSFVEYWANSGKERLQRSQSSKASDLMGLARMSVYDGNVLLGFGPTENDSYTKVGRAVRRLESDTLIGNTPISPGDFIGFRNGVSLKNVLLGNSSQINISPPIVSEYAVVEVKADVIINRAPAVVAYYLAPEMSFAMVRRDIFSKAGNLLSSTEFHGFEHIEERWVPWLVTRKHFKEVEGSDERRLISTTAFEIKTLELGISDDKALFDTDASRLPVGTYVQDEIMGARYVVGEGPIGDVIVERIVSESIEMIDEVAPATLRDAIESTSNEPPPLLAKEGILSTASSEPVEYRPERSRLLPGIIIACLLFAGVIVYMLHRKRAVQRSGSTKTDS